jgi:mitochondrial fission protein ELM1
VALIERPPLSAAQAVALTNGYAGSNALALGLIEALGLESQALIAPRDGPYHWFAPWGPVDLRARSAPLRDVLRKADILVSVGRTAVPIAAAIKRERGAGLFAIHLQDPRARRSDFDLIWAPEHDRLKGANVISTPTSPHRITPERIAASRPAAARLLSPGTGPVLAALIGGPNKALAFGIEQARELTRAMDSLGPSVRWIVTLSRRTPPDVAIHIRHWAGEGTRKVWDGESENPYPGLFALADGVVVTSDSVNMTGEAVSTGLPVYVFELPGRPSKFDRFHARLSELGATRPISGPFAAWRYCPINPNATLAAEVIARYGDTNPPTQKSPS